MNLIKIPKFFENTSRIILIPSLSLYNSFIKSLRVEKRSLKTAPVLIDCFQPISVESNLPTLIVGPFLGHSGVTYLLSFFKGKALAEVLFVGSCGFYGYSSEKIDYKSEIIAPTDFYILEESKELKKTTSINILSTSPDRASILSSADTYFNNEPKITEVYQSLNINLYDMEMAYIADCCAKLGINFGALTLITDHHFKDQGAPEFPKQVSKLNEVNDLFMLLNQRISA